MLEFTHHHLLPISIRWHVEAVWIGLSFSLSPQLHVDAKHAFIHPLSGPLHSRFVTHAPFHPQKVFVNSSQPTPPFAPPGPPPVPPPPTANTYDVTLFENVLLPKWIAQYTLPTPGQFSFHPHGNLPHPYATSDVAHVLCFTGRLANLSDADRSAWAGAINMFQVIGVWRVILLLETC